MNPQLSGVAFGQVPIKKKYNFLLIKEDTYYLCYHFSLSVPARLYGSPQPAILPLGPKLFLSRGTCLAVGRVHGKLGSFCGSESSHLMLLLWLEQPHKIGWQYLFLYPILSLQPTVAKKFFLGKLKNAFSLAKSPRNPFNMLTLPHLSQTFQEALRKQVLFLFSSAFVLADDAKEHFLPISNTGVSYKVPWTPR